MLLVGYDDDRGAFRVLSSWGSWGDHGYCWMSYSTFAKLAYEVFSPMTATAVAPLPFAASQPISQPSLVMASGYTRYDFSSLQAVAFIQFQLSEPMLVQTLEIVHEPSRFSYGVRPVDQWMLQSYFNLNDESAAYGRTFAPAIYGLILNGISRSGATIRIEARLDIRQRS